MGSRKICFEGDDGQYGTCIQDDEDCMKCDMHSRELHYKMVAKYNKSNKVTIEEHTSNITHICEEMDILRQTVYGLSQLAEAARVLGLQSLCSDLMFRSNNIDDVMNTTLQLVRKHQHEELLMAEQLNEQLNKVLKR